MDTDTLERPEVEEQEPEGLTAEQIIAEALAVEDGIYFDMPAEVYHAVERLSGTGIERLCISPANFWRGSWLDPEKPEPDEDETKAQKLGKAYHCARLEPEQFEKRYCRAISKDDFDLTSDQAIKAQLKARDLKQTIGDESIVDRARRLLKAGYEGTIFHIAQEEWEAQRNGRIPIEPKFYDEIVRDQERLLGSAPIAALFEGGQSEVSVFWTDEHGIPMKMRIDRLTAQRCVEFKTFENRQGKVLQQAIADAVRYNRYYVKATVYRDGLEAMRTKSLPIRGEATDEQRRMVAMIQLRPYELEFWFVFQEKKGVPNLLARQFKFYSLDAWRESEINALVEEGREKEVKEALSRQTLIFERAKAEIRTAKRQFLLYSQIYSPGVPWAPTDPMGTIDDLDFAPAWVEGKY